MDKLVAMETLVRVVKSGSFSAAAQQLGRSKARVSQTISALEEELGVILLQRTTRSLRLTEAGHRYHHRCTDLLAEIESLENALKEQSASLDGVLRVTAPPGFAARYLDLLTTDFHNRHPQISIDLDLTHRMVDLVEEGVDVAIRITEPRDSSLIARRLAPAPIVAVASPEYLALHGKPKTPADLKKHECLIDSNFRDQQRWRFRDRKGLQTVSVSGAYRVNSPNAICDLAIAGQGIALSPLFVVEQAIADGLLVEVLKGKVAFAWSIYAVYPRRDYLPARVSRYIDHLAYALTAKEASSQ